MCDARNDSDPFSGVRYWDRALRHARQLREGDGTALRTLLVTARADRGPIGVSRQTIDELVREMGIAGHFETSSKENWGIAELRAAILKLIDWSELPRVHYNYTFRIIESFVAAERGAGRVLSSVDDLRRQYLRECGGQSERVSAEVFSSCLRSMGHAGVIRRLTFGDLVLLQPEILDGYAAAVINAARSQPDGLGSLPEEVIRQGQVKLPASDRRSDPQQEKLLMIATAEDLLRGEIALLEPSQAGGMLVFPSQLTRDHEGLKNPADRSVEFEFDGPIPTSSQRSPCALRTAACSRSAS